MRVGGYLKGCRIGFDAAEATEGERGDRRRSRLRSRLAPQNHGGSALSLQEILTAMKTAASKCRASIIGVSSAGVYR
ncbi:MAG: hypothetical protein ACLRSW_02820 [Christensenellaceae bacterium]